MNTITIYLAGPIDDVEPEVARGWRDTLAAERPTGVLYFDPTRAWHGACRATAQAVDFGNRVAIAHADGVLANLSGPGRGFGTIREIEFAAQQQKPVAVAAGLVSGLRQSLLTHDLLVAASVEEALDMLLQKIHSERNAPHPMARMLGLVPPEEEQ